MKNQKGFSSLVLLGLVAAVLIIGGGAYFYTNQPVINESQEQESTVQEQNSRETTEKYSLSGQKKLATTADLAATIDSSIVTSPYPKFTGTVNGAMSNSLGMNLYRKEPSFSRYYSGNVEISNGRWSAALETQLPAGTYTVDMYVLDGHSDFGSNNVITTATLTVQ